MMIKSIVNIFDIGPHLHDIMCAQWMNVKTEQSVIAYGAQFLSLFCAGKPQHLRFFAKLTMAWWTWPYWSRAWKTWSDKLQVLTYAIWSIHCFLLLFLFLLVGSKRHTMIIRHPNKQISVSLFLHQNNKMMNIFHGYRNIIIII